MSELLKVPTFELINLWGELVEAYHGVNTYGGHTAEIYAYRFQAYTPSVHSKIVTNKEAEIELYRQSARQLYELLRLFAETYSRASIKVNGESNWEWLRYEPFHHRLHIEIKPQ